jgi:hypothetical protein
MLVLAATDDRQRYNMEQHELANRVDKTKLIPYVSRNVAQDPPICHANAVNILAFTAAMDTI